MGKSFERQYYVVIYDIFSGRGSSSRWSSGAEWRRMRIARILLEFGIRTQKSVFELEVSKRELREILSKIERVARKEVDRVYIYPIEAKVVKRIERLGWELPLFKSIFI